MEKRSGFNVGDSISFDYTAPEHKWLLDERGIENLDKGVFTVVAIRREGDLDLDRVVFKGDTHPNAWPQSYFKGKNFIVTQILNDL